MLPSNDVAWYVLIYIYIYIWNPSLFSGCSKLVNFDNWKKNKCCLTSQDTKSAYLVVIVKISYLSRFEENGGIDHIISTMLGEVFDFGAHKVDQ